jgi:hypothetical protein
MTPQEKHDEFKAKVLVGLELAYQRLLEFEKQKGTPLVVIRDGKLVKIKVE